MGYIHTNKHTLNQTGRRYLNKSALLVILCKLKLISHMIIEKYQHIAIHNINFFFYILDFNEDLIYFSCLFFSLPKTLTVHFFQINKHTPIILHINQIIKPLASNKK